MSDEAGEKSEEPSAKRLGENRTKGNVLQSRDLAHFIMIGTSAVVVIILGPMLMTRVLTLARAFLERPHEMRIDSPNFAQITQELLLALGFALFVPLLLLLAAAIASSVLQFGLLWSTEKLFQFDLTKLNPIAGFGRLFSIRQVVELVKGVLKITVIVGVAGALIWPAVMHVDSFVSADITDSLAELARLTKRFLVGILVALLVVGGIDYLYQRWEFYKRLRMSKQELKDEYKQMEGDPQIKARLRRLRVERARKRMMTNVPTATVVVTNPTHYAVALKYDRSMTAPLVVAKGMDLIALKIRDIARENSVPIVENPPLARTLHALVEVDQEIHPDHYKAVAEVISFVMRMKAAAVGGSPAGEPVR